jgi:hypothetical protein
MAGSITLKPSLTPRVTAKELSNIHPFVEHIASGDSYKEITSWPRKLNTPPIVDIKSRRTWIERSGESFISTFYLSDHQAGYCNLVHGGVLAALIDDVSAEFCNHAAPTLYALTRSLEIEFERPSPPGAFFLAKAFAPQEFPFDLSNTSKVWVGCEIWTALAGDKLAMVVKAKTLFVLRESLPKLSNIEAQHSIEDVLERN